MAYKKNNKSNMVLDEETGIVMVYLKKYKRGEYSHTKEIAPGWVVDFDKNNEPIQFEIITPSKYFPESILKLLPPEFISF
jgi:hypothetical protein